MPKFNQNTRKTDMSAVLATSVVGSTWHGRPVFSMKPPPRKRTKNTQGQQTSINRFRQAHEYAEEALRSDEKYALYAKGINAKKTSAHAVALQDFLTPPVIHYIRAFNYTGKGGDVITVKATDDFRVENVKVTILDSGGQVLEEGNAERYPRRPFIWKYKTTVANPKPEGTTLQATAIDLPGNETVLEADVVRDA